MLGMAWSVFYPLLNLIVMRIIFTRFFGNDMEHYTTYLFAGNLVFSYYREATMGGMNALTSNAHIFSKVNVPKYMFVLSKNVSAFINFLLTLVVFFVFTLIDQVPVTPKFLLVLYPIGCLILFNIGVGLILSALYMFFRDLSYLYDVFTTLLMYMSAIFYSVDIYPEPMQTLFLCNPVYVYIKYMRVVIIDGNIPSVAFHALALAYALVAVAIGSFIYKKYNHQFLYYI